MISCEYFDITARSNQCPVQMMQHKSREWFGVQFHPEIGMDTEAGEITAGMMPRNRMARRCCRNSSIIACGKARFSRKFRTLDGIGAQ